MQCPSTPELRCARPRPPLDPILQHSSLTSARALQRVRIAIFQYSNHPVLLCCSIPKLQCSNPSEVQHYSSTVVQHLQQYRAAALQQASARILWELQYYIPGSAHAAQTTTGRINQVCTLTSPGNFERPSLGIVHSPWESRAISNTPAEG